MYTEYNFKISQNLFNNLKKNVFLDTNYIIYFKLYNIIFYFYFDSVNKN